MSSHPKSLFVALVALLLAVSAVRADVKVGQPFPNLGGYGLEGQLPSLEGKVVLVDFWATWCGPCKSSFPAYARLQRDLADSGFILLAVSIDKQKSAYDEFLRKFQPPFPTVRDAGQRLVGEIKVPAMPTSYLLDRRGILRAVHTGYHGEATAEELRAQITKLLEEKP